MLGRKIFLNRLFSTKLADEESNELIFAFISIFDQIQAECRDAGKGNCLSSATVLFTRDTTRVIFLVDFFGLK